MPRIDPLIYTVQQICSMPFLIHLNKSGNESVAKTEIDRQGPSSMSRKMAAPVLAVRTGILFRSFKNFTTLKPFIPAIPQYGVQTANYHPKPLKWNLKDPYIPDKASERTPEWQRTDKFDRKLYGRYGEASGIDPATLWPTGEKLEEMIKDEAEWQPTLEVMLKNISLREEEEAAKRRAK